VNGPASIRWTADEAQRLLSEGIRSARSHGSLACIRSMSGSRKCVIRSTRAAEQAQRGANREEHQRANARRRISAATPGDRRARSRGGNHCPSRWADSPRVRRESDGIVPSLPGRMWPAGNEGQAASAEARRQAAAAAEQDETSAADVAQHAPLLPTTRQGSARRPLIR
jgi:hypothetical protein